MIAALASRRADRIDILELLLSFGAATTQRGVNDFTPLHYAVSLDDPKAIELLLAHGADAQARTQIDDFESPLEMARRMAEQGGQVRALETIQKFARR